MKKGTERTDSLERNIPSICRTGWFLQIGWTTRNASLSRRPPLTNEEGVLRGAPLPLPRWAWRRPYTSPSSTAPPRRGWICSLVGVSFPSPEMQLRRVSCPSTKDLGKDGAAPSRSGLSLGSPSGTTAPPPSFSRQAAADCSLLPFLSPSRKQRWQVRCSRFVGKQSR